MVQVQPPPVQCYSLCGSTGWVVAGVGGSVKGSVGDSVGCMVWVGVVCTRCGSVACSVSGSVLADQYRSPSLRPKLLLQFWETALLEIKT